MKKRILLGIVMMALVLLAVAIVWAGPAAQEPEPQGAAVGPAGVGTGTSTGLREASLWDSTGFTYQGKLESGGESVDEDCEMAFRLYDTGRPATRRHPVGEASIPKTKGHPPRMGIEFCFEVWYDESVNLSHRGPRAVIVYRGW